MTNLINQYVIYRVDFDYPINESITIKSIWDDEGDAKEEIHRLNELNSDKGVEYFYQVAKKYPRKIPKSGWDMLVKVNDDRSRQVYGQFKKMSDGKILCRNYMENAGVKTTFSNNKKEEAVLKEHGKGYNNFFCDIQEQFERWKSIWIDAL